MWGSSDQALLKRASAGDAKAARLLVERLSPRAYALAWRMLGNPSDAQDVVQEGFIRLFRLQQFEGRSSLGTYFHTVVSRLCLDRLRSQPPQALDLDELDGQEADTRTTPHVRYEKSQTTHQIQAALNQLPPRQRLAIALWAYQDASLPEIAQVLEIEPNAAHQLLHRAKSKLKHLIQESIHGTP